MIDSSFIGDFLKWASIVFCLLVPALWMVSSAFRYYVKVFSLGTSVIVCSGLLALGSLPWPGDVTNYRTCKWLFTKASNFLNIKWELRGGEKLQKLTGPCIFVCNHQSMVDLIGMMQMWPDRCVPMMKEELKYYGPFGIAGVLTGSVFVDRFNKDKAIETCNKTIEYLKSKNVKLWVFPEGTRAHSDEMLPFKKGAFHLAIQGQLPIVPIVFSSYAPFYSKKGKRFDGDGFVMMEVLDTIPTDGMQIDNVTELSVLTRSIMMDAFKKLSVEAAQRYEAKDY